MSNSTDRIETIVRRIVEPFNEISGEDKKIPVEALSVIKRHRQVARGVVIELLPFLDHLCRMDKKSPQFSIFSKAYSDFEKRLKRAEELETYLLFGITEPSRGGVKDSIYPLFLYLGVVESLGNTISDILVMLLVANGQDFHIERRYGSPRVKHAVSIMDLEEERVPLAAKLDFMKENGIKTVASSIDTRLRNDIAHLRLDVSLKIGNLQISVRGKRTWVAVNDALADLFAASSSVLKLLKIFAHDTGFTSAGASPVFGKDKTPKKSRTDRARD